MSLFSCHHLSEGLVSSPGREVGLDAGHRRLLTRPVFFVLSHSYGSILRENFSPGPLWLSFPFEVNGDLRKPLNMPSTTVLIRITLPPYRPLFFFPYIFPLMSEKNKPYSKPFLTPPGRSRDTSLDAVFFPDGFFSPQNFQHFKIDFPFPPPTCFFSIKFDPEGAAYLFVFFAPIALQDKRSYFFLLVPSLGLVS